MEKRTGHRQPKLASEKVICISSDADQEDDSDFSESDLDDESAVDEDDEDEEEEEEEEEEDSDSIESSDYSPSDDSSSSLDSERPLKKKGAMTESSQRFKGKFQNHQAAKVHLPNPQKTKMSSRLKNRRNGHIRKASLSKSKGDQENFREVMDAISGGGDLEALKLDHCKAYLRSYSLRVSGSKEILIKRIKEHLELKDGGGMEKYPRSTFVMDCTGDACIGDIVLFKQKVYKNYDKVKRSSTEPPIGKRVIAGRIVKESYGAKKQQHTFTVEVLWSRGPEALPPLYPLIIKGRNLYRLRTFRQRWPNEEDRKRALEEKHLRGSVARNDRMVRLTKKQRCRSSSNVRINQEVSSIEAGSKRKQADRDRRDTLEKRRTKRKIVAVTHHEGTSEIRQKYSLGSTSSDENFTDSTLFIEASSAGAVIGRHGTNIKEITRVSAARLQICEDRRDPTLRVVKITGTPEQRLLARELVVQSLVEKGYLAPDQLMSSKQNRHPFAYPAPAPSPAPHHFQNHSLHRPSAPSHFQNPLLHRAAAPYHFATSVFNPMKGQQVWW